MVFQVGGSKNILKILFSFSISSLYAWFAYATITDNLLPKIASTQIIQQRIIKTMLKNYDWRVRPHGMNESWNETGGPVLIKVNIYFRSISKIDDVNMASNITYLNPYPAIKRTMKDFQEYSTQFTFREEWTDNRLAYEALIKNMSDSTKPKFVILVPDDKSQQIWMPDTFFQNEKAATRHFVDKPNVMIRIYPNGSILYSVRYVACWYESVIVVICKFVLSRQKRNVIFSQKAFAPILNSQSHH